MKNSIMDITVKASHKFKIGVGGCLTVLSDLNDLGIMGQLIPISMRISVMDVENVL